MLSPSATPTPTAMQLAHMPPTPGMSATTLSTYGAAALNLVTSWWIESEMTCAGESPCTMSSAACSGSVMGSVATSYTALSAPPTTGTFARSSPTLLAALLSVSSPVCATRPAARTPEPMKVPPKTLLTTAPAATKGLATVVVTLLTALPESQHTCLKKL